MITLNRSRRLTYYMKTITILAMFAILAGVVILATTAMTSAIAQEMIDNATMGNMTGGNMTMGGGNMTDGNTTTDQVGSISKKSRT